MADRILTVQPPEGGTLWQMGGRQITEPDADGTTRFTITGGRLARRINEHHATLVCGECHAEADIERADGDPLSDSDIVEALTAGLIHECTAWQPKIKKSLADTFKPDGVETWLRSRNRMLGNRVPQEMIEAGEGERVFGLAEFLAEGSFA